MTDDDLTPPEATKADRAHSLAKAGISAIPVLGGPAAELFTNVIQPPLDKRRTEWMNKIAERIESLEKNREVSLESLRENDEFISAVTYASQLALRTHNEAKLSALRNAVTNIAIGQAPVETLQHIFLNLVDSLTELHIRILKAFQSPKVPPSLGMGGLDSVLEFNLPDMRGNKGLYSQVWKELFDRGLISSENLNLTMSGSGLAQKRTTPMGDAFLLFISESE